MSQSRQRRISVGASPGKLALIGVLAVVLVGVVVSNWPTATAAVEHPADGNRAPRPAAPAASPVQSPPASTMAAGQDDPFGKFGTNQDWPEAPLSQVTKFDPFAMADWARPPEELSPEAQLNEDQVKELLASKNAIIFMAGNKRIARIGAEEFRVGDVIGRFIISDISSQGVVLSEKE